MNRCIALFLICCGSSLARAEEGDALALRVWPHGVVSIETHWGLRLIVNPHNWAKPQQDPAADRVVALSSSWNHVLSRPPNAAAPTWQANEDLAENDPHRLVVQSLGTEAVSILADGVCVVVARPKATLTSVGSLPAVDVLALVEAPSSAGKRTQAASLVQSLRSPLIVCSGKEATVDKLRPFQEASAAEEKILQRQHNTLALSASKTQADRPQIVVLAESPWKMPAELSEPFVAMEKACHESQQVFARLSPQQLNFQPANGTHTPRWNSEHMMGRQLLFFSQIYHQLDPTIPVMDLNPQQMPPDYVAAHPAWDGAEEARQMQRVSEFCRRFAYLLDGHELDQQAPGSRWPTLRALLLQMQRHYAEHTANTIKKFDLPNWPAS